jgi:hypothetical protein
MGRWLWAHQSMIWTRQHRVAGGHQCAHEQAPVGLRGDHHLGRVLDEGGDQLVEAGHALHALGQPGPGQAVPLLVLHVHVVVGLGPVVSYEHLPHLNLLIVVGCQSPRRPAAR